MESKNADDKSSILREENKKKKQMLEQDFGITNWFESDSDELPPEVESLFLDNIVAFEKSIKIASSTTVYKIVNCPVYRKLSELKDEEIEAESDRIRAILLEHQIVVDILYEYEVSKQDLYHFLTEELFFEEISDVKIPGMFTYFVYEDFHPNHYHDIRCKSLAFMNSYFDKSSEKYKYYLSAEAVGQDWHTQFRNAFSTFIIEDYLVDESQHDLNLKKADINIVFDIRAVPDGSDEYIYIKGKGKLHLVYEYDLWFVNSVVLPTPRSTRRRGH